MRLTGEQQQTLRAAVDRIIPPDDYPDAWQSGDFRNLVISNIQVDYSSLVNHAKR
jgi:hypothetical protein